MNIAGGKLADDKQAREWLDRLNDTVMETLEKAPLDISLVVEACETLSQTLNERDHLPVILNLGLDEARAREQLAEVKFLLGKEYLLNKLKTELGENYPGEKKYIPINATGDVREKICPLGVLLHIAAGNAEGLPVFSVIEGLLAGNINILKLPGMDDGVSVRLLMELIRIQPLLAEYIYVFDYPSEDLEAIQKMASVSDAVIVWGGDQAVHAVRRLASENMKIIEWGHKISLAYITKSGMKDEEGLERLAHNICSTDQLLCSSCQGIYLDTGSMEDVHGFCQRFLNVLERVGALYHRNLDPGLRAKITLQLRNMEDGSALNKNCLYRGRGCSLMASAEEERGTAVLFRNCWVKRLPRENILKTLRPDKNHLQTLGLVCAEGERVAFCELFCKTGLVRVVDARNMSENYAGAPHDGEYALRRYTKIMSFEF